MITGLTFIDEDTVVVGHCAGSLVFVTFGMSHNPFILPIGTTRKSIQIQLNIIFIADQVTNNYSYSNPSKLFVLYVFYDISQSL